MCASSSAPIGVSHIFYAAPDDNELSSLAGNVANMSRHVGTTWHVAPILARWVRVADTTLKMSWQFVLAWADIYQIFQSEYVEIYYGMGVHTHRYYRTHHALNAHFMVLLLPLRSFFVMFSKFVMFSNRLCNWFLQLALHICYLFGRFVHQPWPCFYLIQSNWRARLKEQHKCGTIHCKKLEHFMKFIIIVIVFGLFLV